MPLVRAGTATSLTKDVKRRPAPRIGAYLVALAIIPLAASAWFAAVSIRSAENLQRDAHAVEEMTSELLLLTALRAALLDEQNWIAASGGIRDLGIPDSVVSAQTGINIQSELANTQARVNSITSQLDLDYVGADLARAREEGPQATMDVRLSYGPLEAQVANETAELMDQLQVTAGGIPDGDDLVHAVQVLNHAINARQAIAVEVTAYFSAQFGPFGLAESDILRLAEVWGLYRQEVAELERLAKPGSASYAGLQAINNIDSTSFFLSAVETLMRESISSGVQDDDRGLERILDDLGTVATAFSASFDTTQLHFALVEAAGRDVARQSTILADDARSSGIRSWATICGVVAVSIIFGAMLNRLIAKPLTDLATSARRLRDGDELGELRVRGPMEVREAAEAIGEASSNLELAQRQATALAAGELDHPALLEGAVGKLGYSLHSAVQTLAASMADREEFRRRLAHEATHDGLTKLANRSATMNQLDRALARAVRSTSSVAVMYIDLDGFKQVNDRQGHLVGDDLLRTVADRLVDAVRLGDHVGRLGGDEFLVIAEPIETEVQAMALANRLVGELGQPITIGEMQVEVSASIGIALAHGDVKVEAEDFLREADAALYEVKKSGGQGALVCGDELRDEVSEQARLTREIRSALSAGAFTMHYQPIVAADGFEPVAYEALIRWKRPDMLPIAPHRFIPFAEQSDLIIAVDRWVVDSVAQQLALWSDHPVLGTVPVAVNISGRTLGSESVVETIVESAKTHGVDPGRLIIEVTESAVVNDLETAATKLRDLRSHGIAVAIDDFGTGYTSLSHLRTMPIDIIKIDRSFTSDPTAQELVKLIIDTGHLLGATITSEGVEDLGQAEALRRLGSDELQGYYFAKPAPPEEIMERSVPPTPRPSSDAPEPSKSPSARSA